MQLWTYQSQDFSLTEGRVDPKRSEFAKDHPDAYRKLYDLLGTDQIIWCSTTNDEKRLWLHRHEWELDVPESAFFRIVDCMVWNGILGKDMVQPPKAIDDELRDRAFSMFTCDVDQREKWYAEQVHAMLHPAGDPWDSLFIDAPREHKANVLLRHLIDPQWVRRVAGMTYSDFQVDHSRR